MKQQASFIGQMWFLGTLVPVIRLVQVGRPALADFEAVHRDAENEII